MSLAKIIKEIDKLDDEIISLLEERLALACQAKNFKTHIIDKEREEEILRKISSEYIRDIYRSIFHNSKKKQSESN